MSEIRSIVNNKGQIKRRHLLVKRKLIHILGPIKLLVGRIIDTNKNCKASNWRLEVMWDKNSSMLTNIGIQNLI